MTSSETLITAQPVKGFPFFGIISKYQPVEDDAVVTLADAIIGGHKAELRVIDRAYSVWGSLHDCDTMISIEPPLAKFFEPLDAVCLRQPRIPTRYSEAAEELRQLLPSVGLDTLAKMCGVSDTGYRNWIKGKGIREKQLRRLLGIRALVRALVIQRGEAAANEWILRPTPQLDARSPVDAIIDGDLDDVTTVALTWAAPARRRDIIPNVASRDTDEFDAHELAAEQQASIAVYNIF